MKLFVQAFFGIPAPHGCWSPAAHATEVKPSEVKPPEVKPLVLDEGESKGSEGEDEGGEGEQGEEEIPREHDEEEDEEEEEQEQPPASKTAKRLWRSGPFSGSKKHRPSAAAAAGGTDDVWGTEEANDDGEGAAPNANASRLPRAALAEAKSAAIRRGSSSIVRVFCQLCLRGSDEKVRL